MRALPGICRACRVRVWWNGLYWRGRGNKRHVCRFEVRFGLSTKPKVRAA